MRLYHCNKLVGSKQMFHFGITHDKAGAYPNEAPGPNVKKHFTAVIYELL
jgi:hypothetical protein